MREGLGTGPTEGIAVRVSGRRFLRHCGICLGMLTLAPAWSKLMVAGYFATLFPLAVASRTRLTPFPDRSQTLGD